MTVARSLRRAVWLRMCASLGSESCESFVRRKIDRISDPDRSETLTHYNRSEDGVNPANGEGDPSMTYLDEWGTDSVGDTISEWITEKTGVAIAIIDIHHLDLIPIVHMAGSWKNLPGKAIAGSFSIGVGSETSPDRVSFHYSPLEGRLTTNWGPVLAETSKDWEHQEQVRIAIFQGLRLLFIRVKPKLLMGWDPEDVANHIKNPSVSARTQVCKDYRQFRFTDLSDHELNALYWALRIAAPDLGDDEEETAQSFRTAVFVEQQIRRGTHAPAASEMARMVKEESGCITSFDLKGSALRKLRRKAEYRVEWGEENESRQAAEWAAGRVTKDIERINLTAFDLTDFSISPGQGAATFAISIGHDTCPHRLSVHYSPLDGRLQHSWPSGDDMVGLEDIDKTFHRRIGHAISLGLRRILPPRMPPSAVIEVRLPT